MRDARPHSPLWITRERNLAAPRGGRVQSPEDTEAVGPLGAAIPRAGLADQEDTERLMDMMPHAPDPGDPEQYELLMRSLIVERYDNRWWKARPAMPAVDDEVTCARRRRELAADFDAFDQAKGA